MKNINFLNCVLIIVNHQNGQFIVLPVQENFSEIPEKYEP